MNLTIMSVVGKLAVKNALLTSFHIRHNSYTHTDSLMTHTTTSQKSFDSGHARHTVDTEKDVDRCGHKITQF